MLDSNRLAGVVRDLEAELHDTEDRATKLRRLIEAARDVLPHQLSVQERVPDHAVNANGRPPLKQSIATVLREAGPGAAMSLAAMTEALWQRGWVGATKEGKPSKETVRGAMLRLQRDGVLVGKGDDDPAWEPTLWRLSNVPLRRPVDYADEGGEP